MLQLTEPDPWWKKLLTAKCAKKIREGRKETGLGAHIFFAYFARPFASFAVKVFLP